MRPTSIFLLVLLALGLAGAALWPLHGRPLVLVPFCMMCGVGFGLFQVPNNRNMFLSAPRARSGAAGGLQATARLTGQTLGGVIMTLLLAVTPIDLAPRLGLGVAAVLTLTAGLVSLLRAPPHPDPSSSRQRSAEPQLARGSQRHDEPGIAACTSPLGPLNSHPRDHQVVIAMERAPLLPDDRGSQERLG
mgnify:CR=1 FL=1